MSLLRSFLRIDSDRRSALDLLRNEAQQRRGRIEELALEAKRKRDEISMLEQGLHRLADDIARVEQELLEMDKRRDEQEEDARQRKAAAVREILIEDRHELAQVVQDFRRLRSEFQSERERLLSQADTGRMMDNYFQIEMFLKDAGQPIPDAARKALGKERADLLAKIGPLVAPPPSPEGVFRATLAYSVIEATPGSTHAPRAIVAFGLPDEVSPSVPTDLAATFLYGAYASAVEKLGSQAPRPKRQHGVVVFEASPGARALDEIALDLFLAVEEGLKRAAAAVSVRCELTGVFVEPEIAVSVFS